MSAPSALEDARELLKFALEIVEMDGGYCEQTRLMESVASAYIKACEALEEIANQGLSIDMSVDDQLDGDFEGAYNHIVELARAALSCSSEPISAGSMDKES